MPEQPGNIVDEDVFVTKDNRRSNNGVGQRGVDDSLFKDSLAAEVRELGCFCRVGNAHMHYAANASFLSCLNEYLCVLHSLIKRHRPMRKANPIGVVESCCPLQVLDQFLRFVKVERMDTYLVAEWIGIIGMPREGANLFSHCQQSACDIFPCIAEGSSNDVDFGI